LVSAARAILAPSCPLGEEPKTDGR
jgi:hypothetical protein